MSWEWLAVRARCLGVSGAPTASCPWLPTSLALNLPCFETCGLAADAQSVLSREGAEMERVGKEPQQGGKMGP